jgi:GT2 family glycosyltransferase
MSPQDNSKPQISVMIPVYEPGELLLKTLESVLVQTNKEITFQIAIVDDASPSVDVTALVAPLMSWFPFEIYRNQHNLQLAGNWNRAIELARGDLIHILHQDDIVLPGFYQHMLTAFSSEPRIGMAFCRHAFITESGVIEKISRRERRTAGVLPNWLKRISKRDRLQCAAAIVHKSVYDEIGGYRNDLIYALDWEMWVRIALHYPVWFEPAVLACYRRHSGSATNRLAKTNLEQQDLINAIDHFAPAVKQQGSPRFVTAAYLYLAYSLLRRARKLLKAREPQRATAILEIATMAMTRLESWPRLHFSWRRWQLAWRLLRLRRALRGHSR